MSDRDGDVDVAHGFLGGDTRFLSHWRLTVSPVAGGVPPVDDREEAARLALGG